MEQLDYNQQFNDDVLESVKNLVEERNKLADEKDDLLFKIDSITHDLKQVKLDLAHSYSRSFVQANIKTISESVIQTINNILTISKKCGFLDDQWYLNFLDKLNELSIDQDR